MVEREPAWNVVVDEEERYSIWPSHRDMPRGWRAVKEFRSRQACVDHIEHVWTDMLPRSLRGAVDSELAPRHGTSPGPEARGER